jgi:mono/diheme cytochrome c family protein
VRSRVFIPIRFLVSRIHNSRRGTRPGEPLGLQNAAVSGFVGLVLFALSSELKIGEASAPPPLIEQGNVTSLGSALPGNTSPATSDQTKPARTRPSRTPALVFRSECLKCHDSDGSGDAVRHTLPKIPDFTDPEWQDSRSDLELSRSILEGKGKSMRPMNDVVEVVDVKDLVAFIRKFRGGKQVVPENPERPHSAASSGSLDPIPADHPRVTQTGLKAQNGSRLFQQFCTKCHGGDGAGMDVRARSFAIPNFTDPAWQAQRSDHQLAVSILDGKGTRMPSFRGRVGDKEAQDLVAFVRERSKARLQPIESAPTDFESRFNKLEQQFGDLKRELQKLSPDKER